MPHFWPNKSHNDCDKMSAVATALTVYIGYARETLAAYRPSNTVVVIGRQRGSRLFFYYALETTPPFLAGLSAGSSNVNVSNKFAATGSPTMYTIRSVTSPSA
jgi:hypothetical protein